jgi:hypothetical protein
MAWDIMELCGTTWTSIQYNGMGYRGITWNIIQYNGMGYHGIVVNNME